MLKPITNTFGGYPHSEERIFSETNPQTTYGLLQDNLKWQLQSRPKQMRYLSGAMHRSTERKLQKLIAKGWMVQSYFREPFLRRVKYDLVRPQVTREEEEFLGWR